MNPKGSKKQTLAFALGKRYWWSLCFIFLCFLSYPSHAINLDSLHQCLSAENQNENVLSTLLLHRELGAAYQEKEDYTKSNEHFHQALKLAIELRNPVEERDILFSLGDLQNEQDNYPEALQYYFQVLDLEAQQNEEEIRLSCFDQIALIYKALGDYEKAYTFQLKGLALVELQKDSVGMARFLHRIGTNFFYQERFEQALEYYQKSKVICDALGMEKGIYACLEALGSVYLELGDQQKSAVLSQRSLELAYKMDYKRGIAYSLGNVGNDQMMKEEYAAAESSLLQSIQLKNELNDSWGLIGGLIMLGNVYKATGNYQSAQQKYDEALSKAEQINSLQRKLEIYKVLAEFNEQIDEPRQSIVFYKQYLSLKDSMMNEKTLEKMGQSKTLYEVQKKESEIAMLKKENELLEKTETIGHLQLSLVVGALIFMLLVSILLLRGFWQSQKSNDLLAQKNQLLESKHHEIELKNRQLALSNKELEDFAYVASHDLKEPLRTVNSYTTLFKMKYAHLFDEHGHEFMGFITDATQRMQVLLEDLLAYSRVGAKNPDKDWVAMDEVVQLVQANLNQRIKEQKAIIKMNTETFPKVKGHKTQLQQLMQNLINNAIKFKGENDPEVTISFEQKKQHYTFAVSDNGIGIAQDYQQKIFEMFKRLHTRTEYEGTGIGLATCKKIVSIHGGDIWVESEEGQGSTFYFTLPHG